MTSSNSNPWHKYLEDVLGVRAVNWPQAYLAELSAPEIIEESSDGQQARKAHIKLMVVSGAESAADYELLEKILLATKLSASEILIVDHLDQAKKHFVPENQTLFVFGGEGSSAEPEITNQPKVFNLPKLADIRANDSLKRPVWEKIKLLFKI